MRRKLTDNPVDNAPERRALRRVCRGFTLTEVVVASALLITAMVPILKALTSVHVHSTIIEHKTRSAAFAQAKLEQIRARSIYNYATNYTETNTQIEGSYLCTVADTSVSANLRAITVMVGFDADNNSILAAREVQTTLETLIARRD